MFNSNIGLAEIPAAKGKLRTDNLSKPLFWLRLPVYVHQHFFGAGR